MNTKYHIATLPGDGIGPEIMLQAYKIINIINKKFNINIITKEYDVGGIAIDKHGTPLPLDTIKGCEQSDAILFGSVGGNKWNHLPKKMTPEYGGLLKLRKHFNLFANLRNIKLYPEISQYSMLRSDIAKIGFDILYVRELTGGLYFGKPCGRKGSGLSEYAFDTEIYYRYEIERIAHIAFKMASTRKNNVTSIDKSNVLNSSLLWREIVTHIGSTIYPDVILSHLYIDNAAMEIIKNPYIFDVILCSNLFGDILSDESAMLSGSIGMIASASINEKNFGLYEPAGGSAPLIAKKNVANPIAQILCVSLLLKHSLKLNEASEIINKAVYNTLKNNFHTQDLFGFNTNPINTDKMGDIIVQFIDKE